MASSYLTNVFDHGNKYDLGDPTPQIVGYNDDGSPIVMTGQQFTDMQAQYKATHPADGSGPLDALKDMSGGLAIASLPFGVNAIQSAFPQLAGANSGLAGSVGSLGPTASLAPNSYAPNALGTMTDSPISWDTASASMPAASPESASQLAQWGMAGSPYAGASGSGSIFSQPAMAGAAGGLFSGIGSSMGGLLSNPALLGAGLGAAAGAFGGGSKPAGTVTSVQDIPDWLKPYVTGNLNAAAAAMPSATQGAQLLPAAQNQLSKTINGDYLNPSTNPYFASAVNDALGQAGTAFAGQYGGSAGLNLGNSGYQEGLARTLGTLATNAYSQNYTNERNNQVSAAGAAPAFAGQSASAALQPFNSFAGLFPNVRTQSQPYFQNSFGNIASGALGGAALGKAFG